MQVEFQVSDPKDVVRLDNNAAVLLGNPPVTTMTLKIKTVVNPSTQASEIISLSALCHRSVKTVGETDARLTLKSQQAISLIRPLGDAANKDAGGLTTFPHDFKATVAFISGIVWSSVAFGA